MAKNTGRCCRHEHYGDDELWVSLDELVEIVRMTVQQCLAMPDQRLPAAERDQIRARLEASRARNGTGPADPGGQGQRGP
jgi:hypothetical protein